MTNRLAWLFNCNRLFVSCNIWQKDFSAVEGQI